MKKMQLKPSVERMKIGDFRGAAEQLRAMIAHGGGAPASATAKPTPSGAKPTVAPSQSLSNADVQEMVREGLPDSLIIEKIRLSGSRFDNSVPALIALKRTGASPAVLAAVQKSGTAK